MNLSRGAHATARTPTGHLPGFTRMHPPIVRLIPILTVNPAAFDTTAGAKAKEDMKSTPNPPTPEGAARLRVPQAHRSSLSQFLTCEWPLGSWEAGPPTSY